MLGFINRILLKKKLFGFVTLLLSLTLAVAIFTFLNSYQKSKKIQKEITTLAEKIIPIQNIVGGIDIDILTEELHLERILRIFESKRSNKKKIKKEVKKFEALGQLIDLEIKKAEKIIDEALKDKKTLTVEDAIQFSRVATILKNVKKEHKEYHNHAKAIIKAFLKKNYMLAYKLERGIDREEDHVDKEIMSILIHLSNYVQSQARQIEDHEKKIFWVYLYNLIDAVIIFLIGVFATKIITDRLVRPINAINEKANEIARGNLDVSVQVTTNDEVGQLAKSFNKMAYELRRKEKVKETFGKYVDPRIVESLIMGEDQNDELPLDGEKKIMTVFFSDIEGFSTISEALTPVALVTLLNRYFSLASEPITAEKGVIDKYIGDAIMAFWGPPFTAETDHALKACAASLEQFEKLLELKLMMPELMGFRKGLPNINIRIGLCTGELLVGNIGSNTSKAFTVMGDTVNIAARLESANKKYGTRILISGETNELAKDKFLTREVDNVIVMGKMESVKIHQLMEHKDKAAPQVVDIKNNYESGLSEYRNRNWTKAIDLFNTCLSIDAEDGPSKVLIDRIGKLQKRQLPENWDGVWKLESK